MNHRLAAAIFLVLLYLPTAPLGGTTRSASPPNPFYAMDTAFERPGLSQGEQFDLVKELGYAGIAWHEQSPAMAAAAAREVESRGMKMFAIYCAATVSPDGTLSYSPDLPKLIEALKGHGTIIWLHIAGNGPAIHSLTGGEPLVKALRSLADIAAANDLRIALYPHFGEYTAHFADAIHLAKLVHHSRLGITFNLCHCLATGDEPNIPTLLDDARDLLFIVTLNGADTGITGPHWNKLIQPLGQGSFTPLPLLKKLKAINFTGPIGFQGYGIPSPARTILTPTIKTWHRLSADADAE